MILSNNTSDRGIHFKMPIYRHDRENIVFKNLLIMFLISPTSVRKI